jgi:UDP-N-acetylmuramoyl-tripeptide--D-alanyl-D-alanine ligase
MSFVNDILNKIYSSTGVSIDTRTMIPGAFFIGIKGNRVNGSACTETAFKKGALFALIDDPRYAINDRCIVVNNTIQTLQEIATLHRKKLKNISVVVVAGSNGKTTTKDLIFEVLNQKYRVYKSIANLNNHIGVPLNILNLTKDIDMAVIEIGANAPNEHALLLSICQPQFGIVTNSGKDHLEGYKSEKGVIASNKDVYDYLTNHKGHAFVNSNDKTLVDISIGAARTFYGTEPNTLVKYHVTTAYPTISVRMNHGTESVLIKTHLYGHFQADNIGAATCIGLYFGVTLSKIKTAINHYLPQNNRSETMQWRGNTILLDAYNANPSSMLPMIDYFDKFPAQNKLMIIGGMNELGFASSTEHLTLINRLKHVKNCIIYLVGPQFLNIHNELKCTYFETSAPLLKHMHQLSIQGFHILVKGSRSFALEKIFNTSTKT